MTPGEPQSIFSDAAAIAAHRGGCLRVLGPPGCGKTTALAARFESLEASGRRVAVVTYGREQRDRLVERLLRPGACRVGGVPVFTFPALARRVIGAADPARGDALSELEEHVLLDAAVDEARVSLTSDYKSIADSFVLRRVTLSIIHELQQAGFDAPQLQSAADRAESERARDLMRIACLFEKELDKHGAHNFSKAPWVAARAIERNEAPNPLAVFDAVLVDDFGDVDAGQFALLISMVPPRGNVTLDVFGDPSGPRFAFRGTSGRFLSDEYSRHYDGTTMTMRPACPRGDGVREAFAGLLVPVTTGGPQQTSSATVREHSRIAECVIPANSMDEARWIAARARVLIDETGCDPSDIGVIARDPTARAHEIVSAFSEQGVPINAPADGHRALEDFALSAMLLLSKDVRDDDSAVVREFLSSPCYALLREHLATHLGLGERRADRDAREAWEKDRILAELRKRSIRGKRFSMPAFLAAAIRPVIHQLAEDAKEVPPGVSSIARQWGRYEDASRRIGQTPSPRKFVTMLRRFAPGEKAPDRGNRATLVSPREAVSRRWAHVFVAGLSDGVFPQMGRTKAFVPWGELERITSVAFDGGRSLEAQQQDEYALMLTALTRSDVQIFLSSPKQAEGRELPGPVAPVAGLFESASPVDGASSSSWRSACNIARARGLFGENVPDGAGEVDRLVLTDAGARTPFHVRPFALSASRISGWFECPRRVFYGRALGMRGETGTAARVGSMFHNVLEQVCIRFPDRDERVAKGRDNGFADLIRSVCEEERDLPSNSIAFELTEQTLQAYVGSFLDLEAQRGPSKVECTEGDAKLVLSGVEIVGRVDRVDSAGPLVVIDYKTTKNFLKTGRGVRDRVVHSDPAKRLWQVLLYVRWASEQFGRWPDTFCYYWFPPDGEPLMVGVHFTETAVENATFPENRRRFALVTPEEVESGLADIKKVSTGMFSPREEFERTESYGHCRLCDFNKLCRRTA